MKALVVDDSRSIRTILGRALNELGFDVSQAGNGKEALKVLEGQAEPPNLALVDWNMPEMNGLEFIRSVRANQRYGDMRIMMVTTETQIEQMVLALESGANEYVMKPFTREVIHEKLRVLGLA